MKVTPEKQLNIKKGSVYTELYKNGREMGEPEIMTKQDFEEMREFYKKTMFELRQISKIKYWSIIYALNSSGKKYKIDFVEYENPIAQRPAII